jgi:cell division protein FtsQ
MIRHIALITASFLLLAGTAALVGFAQLEEQNIRCKALAVDVEEIDGMFFVDVAGVKDAIFQHDSINGSFFADLNLTEVANWVRTIPAVDDVQVYPGLDRVLHIKVSQRKPIARLHVDANIDDLYIDSEGNPLELSPYFTARVPIIHAASVEAAQPAIDFIQTIRHNSFWAAFCDQIAVRPQGEIEIIPRIGNARIALDNTKGLQNKLDKLFTFYHEQISRGNLNDYKRIDLSYQDQVVAQRYY